MTLRFWPGLVGGGVVGVAVGIGVAPVDPTVVGGGTLGFGVVGLGDGAVVAAPTGGACGVCAAGGAVAPVV